MTKITKFIICGFCGCSVKVNDEEIEKYDVAECPGCSSDIEIKDIIELKENQD